MTTLVDLVFHLDEWLNQITMLHPIIAYSIFFGIVFSESAFFPAAPFLPGDGLLFAVGVLAADGAVQLTIAIPVLICGGVVGNWLAYKLGTWLGPAIFDRFRWLNRHRNYYQKAHEFYQRHGYMALLFSRFIPIIRAMVPFVAGIALMNDKDFMKYNIISVSIWVILITIAAFYLGHLPFIKHHFTWVVLGFAGLGLLSILIFGLAKLAKSTR